MAIPYGTALSTTQLSASASVSGTFVYTPAQGSILEAGSHTLSVTFTPIDTTDYTPATANAPLTVTPATPTLSWPTPAPITVGMALKSTQLNAVAKAPGSTILLAGNYLYIPAAGTTFTSAGPQNLTVTFAPTDSMNYTSAEITQTVTVTSTGVAAWGDSLTLGNEGSIDYGQYPLQLQTLIAMPVINQGIGGQTSTQIGVRQGGVPTYANISGGVIPASGGIKVTFPLGYEPVTTQGPTIGTSGTILGVHGTVTLTAGVYTFTRTAPGNPVNAPGSPQFVVDTPFSNYIQVYWDGNNNFWQLSQVLSDIANQVAIVPPGQSYLVLSTINENLPWEWRGGSGYNELVALNDQISATYGAHYLDIRKALVDAYDPSLATDVSDYTHDEPPTSLRAITGSGTLGAAIGPSDTSFPVNLTIGTLSAPDILTIDTGASAENVSISSVTGNIVTVVRALGGNDIAHNSGATVMQNDPIHLNANGYMVVAKAVAEHLSPYSNNAGQDQTECASCW